MLIDRHLVAALIGLSQVARTSEAERDAHQEALETLLVRLYTGASPAARQAFRSRMDPIPQSEKPWAAVVRPEPSKWIGLGPPVPAVVSLVLGQVDDDPDSAEDGNRLPDRDSKEGAAWGPLYAALDRWDTATILRHVGPGGWALPPLRPVPLDEGIAVELVPFQAALRPDAPAPGAGPPPATDPPPVAPSPAPAPALPVPPGAPAFWRRPVAIAGTIAAVAVSGAVVYSLTRSPRPEPF
jgi:hypothetical protein